MESTAVPMSTKDLLEHSSRYGVSRWVNPLLLFPLEPVVLVEGKTDRDFLNQCFRALRVVNSPRVTCLEDVKNDATKGGVETLLAFVKENADVIRARNSYAKVCVLIDWDSASKISSFTAACKTSDPFVAMAWDIKEANSNPFLAQTFKGIERFYPDSVLNAAKSVRSDLFYTNPKGTTTVKKDELTTVKKILSEHVNMGITEADAQFAKPLILRLMASLA